MSSVTRNDASTTRLSVLGPRLLLACSALIAAELPAQTVTTAASTAAEAPRGPVGSIEGFLFGPDGAWVVGSKATASLLETGQNAMITTHGVVIFDDVPEGTYTVQISADGFKSLTVTGAKVRSSRKLVLGTLRFSADAAVTVGAGREYIDMIEKFRVYDRKPAAFSTRNVDLARSEDDVMPYVTFGPKEVLLSGAPDLFSFLNTRLAQNISTNNDILTSAANGLAPVRSLNLSGWNGVGSRLSTTSRTGSAYGTIILVNGVPAPSVILGNQGGFLPTDLSSIPLDSIERIEVLPTSAGAIYGASATGGVVNIITKSGYTGGGSTVRYETHTGASDSSLSASANYTFSLKTGTRVTVTADFQDSTPMELGDISADTVERFRRLAFGVAPEYVIGTSSFYSTILGPTTNFVSSSSTVPLVSGKTAVMGYVPEGYRGGGDASSLSLGSYNLGLSPTAAASVGRYYKLGYDTNQRRNVAVEVNQTFSPAWNASFRISGYQLDFERDGGTPNPSGMTSTTLAAKAATNFNPFAVAVRANWADQRLADLPGLGLDGLSKNTTMSTSLVGKLWGDWTSLVFGSYTRSRSLQVQRNFEYPYFAGVSATSGWGAALNGTTIGTAIYNPFIDGTVASYAPDSFYSRYYQQRITSRASAGQYVGRLKFSGPVWHLPAGNPQLTAMFDYDRTTRRSDSTTERVDTGLNTVVLTTDNPNRISANARFAGRTNLGTAAELNVPIVSEKQRIPLVSALDLQASGRLDRFETAGLDSVDSSVGQYGLKYAIVPDVSFRAAVSEGFTPPTADELTAAAAPTFTQTITDPKTGAVQVIGIDQYITGGNPDLQAAKTKSRSLGVVLTPRWVKGLRASVDYVDLEVKNEISSFGLQTLVDLESALPERITRNSAGVITFIDGRYLNAAFSRRTRFDYLVSYDRDGVFGGMLNLSARASQFTSSESQTLLNTPVIESIGNAHGLGQRDEWPTASLASTWSGDRWSLGWSARYSGPRLVSLSSNATVQNPTNSTNDLQKLAIQGSDTIGSAVFHDVTVSYRYPKQYNATGWRRVLSNSVVSAGARNVFDRDPRFNVTDTVYGVIDSYDNGRSVWLSVTKSF